MTTTTTTTGQLFGAWLQGHVDGGRAYDNDHVACDVCGEWTGDPVIVDPDEPWGFRDLTGLEEMAFLCFGCADFHNVWTDGAPFQR